MVNKFKNILVPYDDSINSKRALNKAVTIANITDAKLTLVHVISYHKAMAKIVGSYKGKLIDYVNKFMTSAKKYAQRENVDVQIKVLYGGISDEISKFMRKNKFDMVIVGRRGTSYITGPSLGSVSNYLVSSSKVPVLVVQ